MIARQYPYLSDNEFLLEIDTQHLQKQYIKLVLLDWDERPIQEIQGMATGGSISINGNSAVRRTCSLNMVIIDPKDYAITKTSNLISIGKKVYLEVGISNNTNRYTDYPIIWFPQGIFVFTSCSSSSSAGQAPSLSLQMKDKMCLLNGECGGTITSSIQLDKMDTIDENGEWVTVQPTISRIIMEAVNHLGGEQIGRIIISDIDERIKTVMRWVGSSPVYWVTQGGVNILTTNKANWGGDTSKVYEYGDDIGFIYNDFIYTSDLIINPGDNICTGILDKIKTFLGNFEYFYDIWGNFVFQEIKNYLNTTQATIELDNLKNSDYLVDMSKGKSVYDFTNSPLVTSYGNTPQYTRIKNDFVIWGTRTDSKDIKHSIRYHLAVDKKPKTGNVYDVYVYYDEEENLKKAKMPLKYESINEFPEKGIVGLFYLDESNGNVYCWNAETLDYEISTLGEMKKILTTDWRTELYLQGAAAEPLGLQTNPYYAELEAEWPKLYNIAAQQVSGQDYYAGAFYDEVLGYPWDVDYWLDFIDSQEAISELNVDLIGRRSLSENKDEYNCVFEQEVPDYILIETQQPDTEEKREECIARNQDYIQVDPNIYNNLAIGGLRNSCFERVKNALYDYTSYNNSISIGCVPIYHLEPNTRITVSNKENDIYGDFMINSISLPLATSGTMNISAVKCTEKL